MTLCWCGAGRRDRRPERGAHHQRAHGGRDRVRPGQEGRASSNILVFDLGGGTFDVSILTIDNGVFEVRALPTGMSRASLSAYQLLCASGSMHRQRSCFTGVG